MLDQPPLTQHAVSGFLVTTRIFGTVFWATENPILNLDLPRLNPGRLTYPSSLTTKKCRPNFSKWPFKGHWKRKKLCANHWRRWEAQSRTNCTNKQKLLTSCWWPFFVRRFLQEVFLKKLPQLMVQVENGAFFHDYQRRHFCPFGVFFLELHCKTPGFDIGIFCWFIPPKKILVA